MSDWREKFKETVDYIAKQCPTHAERHVYCPEQKWLELCHYMDERDKRIADLEAALREAYTVMTEAEDSFPVCTRIESLLAVGE